MFNRSTREHEFESLFIEDTYPKKITKVLSAIRFFPFLYMKHPFCYTMYYLDGTYILLAKESGQGE